MAKSIDDLFDYLDNLTDRADLDTLKQYLAECPITIDDVRDSVQFSERGYSRNLLRSGDWYHALILCWKNGQRSPIHDHTGSSCGIRVLRGTMTETIFEFAPNGHVVPTVTHHVPEGTAAGSEDTDMHQVSNLQAGGRELVTLHIYSPPLIKMGTYSLYDTTRGEEYMLMEFCDAAGI